MKKNKTNDAHLNKKKNASPLSSNRYLSLLSNYGGLINSDRNSRNTPDKIPGTAVYLESPLSARTIFGFDDLVPLLGPQSRFGGKLPRIIVVCPPKRGCGKRV